uniref:Uncharacterized protein n=1 Tax=Rhizochromulina marina TaxID=1034831 RepID=A0A7S2SVN6_9STRA|mmetsp:Transcript_9605/g.27241  ORF Transcript_9605/g.27241 Transcript_9605/m.27241 type:complete len:137 (+) Transcript_9605:1199-1609(+)
MEVEFSAAPEMDALDRSPSRRQQQQEQDPALVPMSKAKTYVSSPWQLLSPSSDTRNCAADGAGTVQPPVLIRRRDPGTSCILERAGAEESTLMPMELSLFAAPTDTRDKRLRRALPVEPHSGPRSGSVAVNCREMT